MGFPKKPYLDTRESNGIIRHEEGLSSAHVQLLWGRKGTQILVLCSWEDSVVQKKG